MTTHLVKHHRLTKREIKEDALVTAAFRATELWERHGRTVLVAVGAVALLLVLAFFVMRTRAQSEARAQGELFKAVMASAQGDYVSAAPMLKELIDNSPGTDAARQAQRYMGDALMSQNKPGDAATWYRKFSESSRNKPEDALAGAWCLSAALESSKSFTEAAAAYADAAKRSSTDNERGRALLGEARCYLRAGQNEKAIETYRAVLKLQLADQPIYDAANSRLGELRADAAK